MKRWLMTISFGLVVLGGCATQRVVQMAPRSAEADSSFLVENLEMGADVEVVFLDGTRQAGQLRAVLAEGLVVAHPGNFGLEETLCPHDKIDRVLTRPETQGPGEAAGNILVGMLLGGILLVAVAVHSLQDGGAGCS